MYHDISLDSHVRSHMDSFPLNKRPTEEFERGKRKEKKRNELVLSFAQAGKY